MTIREALNKKIQDRDVVVCWSLVAFIVFCFVLSVAGLVEIRTVIDLIGYFSIIVTFAILRVHFAVRGIKCPRCNTEIGYLWIPTFRRRPDDGGKAPALPKYLKCCPGCGASFDSEHDAAMARE